HFSRVFNQLKEVITAYPFVKNLCELYELFTQIVRSAKIPFYGEPLKGLQIMGMLETRVLDFENIIMLSVNEDLIPAGKHTNSFIPFEIKRIFKLPTYQDRNAVFAYHFYRLLQRSEQVYILYNTESDQLGGGEKSRFISQILHELPVYNANIRISEEKLEVNVTESIEEEPIEIVKNPEILTKLEKLGNRGFSASAINTYRNCSLQFYFKYIAGLSELEDLEETIESSTLGTVIHDVLRRKYYPLVGKVLSKELILENLTEIKKLVSESFQKHYSGGEIGHGKNLLIYEVACQLIENYIRFEANFAEERIKDEKITIKELEAEFSTGFEFISNGKSRSVIIKGIIDRIDTLGNEIRIIDYKTGLVLNRDVKFRDWSELKSESKLDKCYQLLHYAYILHNSGKYQTQTIQSGIISLRNLSTGFMTLELPGKLPLQEDTFIEFENILTGIIGELFDSNFSFSQTTVKENCIYCPFRTICNR
ncbi:MAG: PD-(D/E)XK nuclease family protein, partial [Bacteroidales bacterium]|nr:PD-(D/E)XK nuclease family protein [Bacteroidales bacterium]